jgi:hypothetical protein
MYILRMLCDHFRNTRLHSPGVFLQGRDDRRIFTDRVEENATEDHGIIYYDNIYIHSDIIFSELSSFSNCPFCLSVPGFYLLSCLPEPMHEQGFASICKSLFCSICQLLPFYRQDSVILRDT